MAKRRHRPAATAIILSLLSAPPTCSSEEIYTSQRHHDKIRFIAIGDWGGTNFYPYHTPEQKDTAHGMAQVAAASSSSPAASFVMTLGDNFYEFGLGCTGDSMPTSTSSEFSTLTDCDMNRIEESFEKIYHQKSLQIPWYVLAGNHDYWGDITKQLRFGQTEGTRWIFPDYNHNFVKEFTVSSNGGGAQAAGDSVTMHDTTVKLEIVMIDTIQLAGFVDLEAEILLGNRAPPPGPGSQDQADSTLKWIEEKLRKSDADYLIVAGHYPVYSVCGHGTTMELVRDLDPLLRKYGVTAYLSGHEHCQFHYKLKGMDYILSGAGKNCCYRQDPEPNNYPKEGETKYVLADLLEDFSGTSGVSGGFASFEVGKDEMMVKLHRENGDVLYETALLPRTDRLKRGEFKYVSVE